MRLPVRLLALGVAAVAAGGVVFALYPGARQATRTPDTIPADLCIVAPATPHDPTSGLPLLAPRAAPADARCPVCGMYPARYPRWAAQIIFRDGATHFFDSPVDLFGFMNGVGRHSSPYIAEEAAASFVTDFDGGGWIDARAAFYVHGSDALGPMRGPDLPAFARREAADAFARAHGGRVRASTALTPELIRPLGRNLHRH